MSAEIGPRLRGAGLEGLPQSACPSDSGRPVLYYKDGVGWTAVDDVGTEVLFGLGGDATSLQGVSIDAGAATPTNLDILIYVSGDGKWHSAAFTNFASSSIQAIGTSTSNGSSADFARGNHVHSIGVGAINNRTMIASGIITANEIATGGTFSWSGAHTFTKTGTALTVDNVAEFGTVSGKSAATLTVKSQGTNGATPQFSFDTLNAVTGANPYLRLSTAGTKVLELQCQGSTHYLQFYDSGGAAIAAFVANNAPGLLVYNTAYFNPFSTNAVALGGSGNRWASSWSTARYGTEQASATSGAVTINPANGETIRVVASANITGLTVQNGTEGQKITLILRQDAGGTSTWPSTINNVRLAGSSFSKTTAANAIDTLSLAWDNTLSDWVETGRATNLS